MAVKDVLQETHARNNRAVGKRLQYDVTAVGLNPLTGAVVAGPRTERVDPATDELFEGCEGLWEIEDAYEEYWNRINVNWENAFPPGKEKVKVLRVERVS
jgi:hypothetical protein